MLFRADLGGPRVAICLANDDGLVPPLDGLLQPETPHQDLTLIAKALGDQTITLPKLESSLSSFGGPCTQIVHLHMADDDD